MASIYTGLFDSSYEYKKLESDLENSGFNQSDYIVFIDNDGIAEFVASVSIKDNSQAEIANEIFLKNHAIKTFLIDNTDLNEMSSYSNIRKWISVHSKAEVVKAPILKIKYSTKGIETNE